MSPHTSELPFRFQYINASGRTVGWRAQAGRLTEQSIELHEEKLSYRAVLDSCCRSRRLLLTLNPGEINNPEITKYLLQGSLLILEIGQAEPTELERFIDRISSQFLANQHREQLEAAGKGREFRSVTCPHCSATVDLSLLNQTPYIYCRFCETIFQEQTGIQTLGTTYRLCDQCGWFDRAQTYTEFYFYFLIFIYGFRMKRRDLCDTCVSELFWKVLFINFIFILGIAPALWMKLKSLKGRDSRLASLSKANALGKRGNYQKADAIYTTLHEHYPQHPGLLFNQGYSHLTGQDAQGAWNFFQQSLQSCSNYAPTARILRRLQESTQGNVQ